MISCPSNQTISIAYANYGRTSEIPCQGKRKYIMTNCKSKTTLIMAKALCEGRRECRITALNTYWGNPCPGILKYMDIRYQCVGQILQENGTQVRGGITFRHQVEVYEIVCFVLLYCNSYYFFAVQM